ncbi:MAG TPA: carboxypeptidase-like regulatory domain-containing protein, partial [Candidatus Polarisedimenticolia bacterium]|nr:carboxypeptidase-like regulatory domain-containing protein [Candidatus Polarisedimenticolia bacterium]
WRLREAGREAAPDVWITATPSGGAGALRRARTDQEGAARLEEVLAGTYRISARAPGYITWSLGPIPIQGTGVILLDMTLVPFPMGFPGSLEDLLVPADPIRTYEP